MYEKSDNSVFSALKLTLSKLYPVEQSMFAIEPTTSQPIVPRFCRNFFRPDVEGYERLMDAIVSYDGKVRWVVGPRDQGLTCIVAWPTLSSGSKLTSPFVGFPPLSVLKWSASEEAGKQLWPTKEFIEEAIADIPQFVRYLERAFKLEATTAKIFDPRLIAPPQAPSLEDEPIDFIEPGMNVTWIIEPDSGGYGADTGASRVRKRMLHFGVTSDEWRVIIEKLREEVDAKEFDSSASPSRLALLSRIQEHDGSVFAASEIEQFRLECLAVRKKTTVPLAIRGLDKLLMTCNWAEKLKGGIYFASP